MTIHTFAKILGSGSRISPYRLWQQVICNLYWIADTASLCINFCRFTRYLLTILLPACTKLFQYRDQRKFTKKIVDGSRT